MKRINKRVRVLFGFAFGLSVGLPAGVLGVIFGAIQMNIPLLVIGIVLVVAGFYGMPILWVQYGERRRDRNLVRMVKEEGIYTLAGLAAQTGLAENVVLERVKKLLSGGELSGYLLVEDGLALNENRPQARPRGTKKCENCGASMRFDGEKFVCEYCKTVAGD